MKKNIIFMISLYFVFLVAVVTVSADSPAEQTPYQIEFENGNKIFYMYLCYVNDENGVPDDNWMKSGLYYNTDPPENIYLINSAYDYEMYGRQIYYYEWELVFSDDGMYFANMPWTWSGDPGKPDGTTIEFYDKGRLMKKYAVADLVEDGTKLVYTVSHVMWEKREERKFDGANNILSITTNDDIIYKFDLTTGNIIDRIKTDIIEIELPNGSPKYIAVIIGAITICIFIMVFIAIRAARFRISRKKLHPKSENPW